MQGGEVCVQGGPFGKRACILGERVAGGDWREAWIIQLRGDAWGVWGEGRGVCECVCDVCVRVWV